MLLILNFVCEEPNFCSVVASPSPHEDPVEADKLLKIQRELDETKIILISSFCYDSPKPTIDFGPETRLLQVSISEVESQTIIYDDVESLNVDASTTVVTTSTNSPSTCAQDETEQQSVEDKIDVEDTHMKVAKARPLEEVAPSVHISSKHSLDDIDEQSEEDKTDFEVTKKKRTTIKFVKKIIKKEKAEKKVEE
ncbi:hypothetical protein V2J09_009742 [Rumex salicifolius]